MSTDPPLRATSQGGSSAALTCTIPLRTVTANVREHHRVRARRVAREIETTRLALLAAFGCTPPPLPVHVHLVRIGPGTPDSDGIVFGLKAARDDIAAWLGCGDSPRDPVTWTYGQERGGRGVFAVRVTITPLLADQKGPTP